jgi:hypothetical protein
MIHEGIYSFLYRNNIYLILLSIHPRTKTDVGYRLSRAGLAVAYGQTIEFQGPIISTAVVATGSTSIDVTYTEVTGIELRNSEGFEVYSLILFIR